MGRRGGYSYNDNQGGFNQNPYNGGNNSWQPGYQNGGYGNGYSTGFQMGYNNGNYNSNYPQGGGYNSEWYSNDSYGGFNNYPYGMSQRGGVGRGSFHQRGMQPWRGGPKKEFFKKKWQAQGKVVANPEAVVAAGQKKKRKKKSAQGKEAVEPEAVVEVGGKKKRKQKINHSKKREAQYKALMSLKTKYTSVRQNKYVKTEDQIALTFLKQVCHDISLENENIMHFVLFSKLLSGHRNALKLFTYEAKKLLEAKYDPNSEEEKEKLKKFVQKTKDSCIKGYKKVYKQRAEKEGLESREKILDGYVAKLIGETFTDEDIPVDEDYLFNKDHLRVEEDFITEFKYRFVVNCFECFKFKPDEPKMPTKDLAKRIRFYLDNPIIPFFIVESMRAKAPLQTVPSPIDKYIFQIIEVYQNKNEACLNDVVALMEKNQEMVVTSMSKYVEVSEGVGTDVIRDFADCLLLFDRFATFIRHRMLKYSPHILLSTEIKEKVFNELVDKMYREVLDIIIKKERLETQVFAEMEKDEVPKENPTEVKEEAEGEKEMTAE